MKHIASPGSPSTVYCALLAVDSLLRLKCWYEVHDEAETADNVGTVVNRTFVHRYLSVACLQYTAPQYIVSSLMAHTIRDKKKLLNRVRRVRGQIEAVERLLESESECSDILQQIAACRGSISGLMAEVLEGHIRFHVADSDHFEADQKKAIEELISITKSYLK